MKIRDFYIAKNGKLNLVFLNENKTCRFSTEDFSIIQNNGFRFRFRFFVFFVIIGNSLFFAENSENC
jgi:hypothetical protein